MAPIYCNEQLEQEEEVFELRMVATRDLRLYYRAARFEPVMRTVQPLARGFPIVDDDKILSPYRWVLQEVYPICMLPIHTASMFIRSGPSRRLNCGGLVSQNRAK